MITILNSSVLTNFGVYEYSHLNMEAARELLLKEGYQSAIGHEETATALSRLLGFEVPVNRIEYRQQPGEKVIVFKIKRRLAAGAIATADEIEATGYETGLLERIN